MKNFKIFLWVLFLFIFQAVCVDYVRIRGIVPDVVFAFVTAFAVIEGDFVSVAVAAVICGVFSGSFGGNIFAFEVLLYTYSALIILKLRDKPKNLPRVIEVVAAAFLFSAAGEAVKYFLVNFTLTPVAAARIFLPCAAYNTVIAAAIYLALKYTVYRKEDKHEKQLI